VRQTLVLCVVGLTPKLLQHAPSLLALAKRGAVRALTTVTPAVTCSVQSTFTTGSLPRDHGIVGNGWYFRELSQVWLWRQSNHLVSGEKIWDAAKRRDSTFTCSKLFWWYNMYASADYSLTPRPMYTADGRKLPDVYAAPPELRDRLQRELGTFPLFDFWGPRASIASSRWIARAAELVQREHSPTLNLVYLPHLDYDLQRFGPDGPEAIAATRAVDELCGELLHSAERAGRRVIVLSEYGITPVSDAVHPNRVLRRAGLLRVRQELGLEQLDAGASDAFAVSDHQIAHVYVRRPEQLDEVKRLLAEEPGVERVLDRTEQANIGLDHPRSGELVLIARPNRWFSYYFWLDDVRAPDYARTVDIHNKPGYDPVELLLDPAIGFPRVRVGMKLLRRKLGFRTLLDVIPLDASLVRGSHGRITDDAADGPLFISDTPELLPEGPVTATLVKDLVLRHVFD
jgi:predicted AlkP superfamily pyrophosphatase or phosphodiesterase